VITVTFTPPQEHLTAIESLPTAVDENQCNLLASTGNVLSCERRPMTPVPVLVGSLPTTELTVMTFSASSSQQNLAPTSVVNRSTNTVLGMSEDVPIRIGAPLAAEGWARDAQDADIPHHGGDRAPVGHHRGVRGSNCAFSYGGSSDPATRYHDSHDDAATLCGAPN